MRTSSTLDILSQNKQKRNEQIKDENLQKQNKQKEFELENEKKAQKLKEEKRALKEEHINYLEDEKIRMQEDIQRIKNPVTISFSGDEAVAGRKYVQLKNKVEIISEERLQARTKALNIKYIFFIKLAATLLFVFILMRLAGEEQDLIASFTYISVFTLLIGENNMALFFDFVVQDIALVSAIAFAIAASFKDYDGFYETKTRTKLFVLFGFSLIGLFVSAMLFAY